MKETLPCIVCHKVLEPVFKEEGVAENQPSSGLAFQTHGHYGSTVWDADEMGRYLEINVCDDCVREASRKGFVAVGKIVEEVSLELWNCDEEGRKWEKRIERMEKMVKK